MDVTLDSDRISIGSSGCLDSYRTDIGGSGCNTLDSDGTDIGGSGCNTMDSDRTGMLDKIDNQAVGGRSFIIISLI